MDYDNSDKEWDDICEKEDMHDAEQNDTKTIHNISDSLTIELLSNKTQYKKYILSKEDPMKYEEYMVFLKKCKKYQHYIVNMVSNLIVQPEHESYDENTKQAFESFVKKCINYREDKDTYNYNKTK